MLLSEYKKMEESVPTIQQAIATVIGIAGGDNVVEALFDVDSVQLENWVKTYENLAREDAIKAREDRTYKIAYKHRDRVELVILYLMQKPCIKISRKAAQGARTNVLHTLPTALANENLHHLTPDVIYKNTMDFLVRYDTSQYLYVLLSTTMIYKKLCDFVKGTYSTHLKINNVAEPVIHDIISDFSSYFLQYSANSGAWGGTIGSRENVIGWIRQSYDFYARDGAPLKYYFEKDLDAVVSGGEDGTTKLDLIANDSKVNTYDNPYYNINFTDVVFKIMNASLVLYGHKRKGGDYVIMYDIFTKYNDGRVAKITRDVTKLLSDFSTFVTVKDVWNSVDDALKDGKTETTTAQGKKSSRDNIAEALEIMLDREIQLEEINELFNDVRKADNSEIFETNGKLPTSVSNGTRLFNCCNYTVKLERDCNNATLFKKLYQGYAALKIFLKHLEARGIDPLSVPVKIFRDPRSYRSFTNLDEYLILGPINSEIRNQAEGHDKTTYRALGLKTSDEIYDTFVIGSASTRIGLIERIKTASICSDLKMAVKRYQGIDRMRDCRNDAEKIFRKYRDRVTPLVMICQRDLDLATGRDEIKALGVVAGVNYSPDEEKQGLKGQRVEYLYASNLERITWQYNFLFTLKQYYPEATNEQLVATYYQDANGTPVTDLQGAPIPSNRSFTARVLHYSDVNVINCFTDEIKISSYLLSDPDRAQCMRNELSTYTNVFNYREAIQHGSALEQTPEVALEELCALATVVGRDDFLMLDDELKYLTAMTFITYLENTLSKYNHPVTNGVGCYALGSDTIREDLAILDEIDNNGSQKHLLDDVIHSIDNCWEVLCSCTGIDEVTETEKLYYIFLAVRRLRYYDKFNLALLGKVTNNFNTVKSNKDAEIDRSKKNDIDRWNNDGDLGVILRASAYITYLDAFDYAGRLEDLPRIENTNNVSYSRELVSKVPYDKMESFICAIHNKYVQDNPELVEIFKTISGKIHTEFSENSIGGEIDSEDDERLDEVLLRASIEIQENRCNAQISDTVRLEMARLAVNAVTDNYGYLVKYNKRYRHGSSNVFVHKTGYTVSVDRDYNYSLNIIMDPSLYEAGYNKVYA